MWRGQRQHRGGERGLQIEAAPTPGLLLLKHDPFMTGFVGLCHVWDT